MHLHHASTLAADSGMPLPPIGGKAQGLLQLHHAGAPVPPWAVLPADTDFPGDAWCGAAAAFYHAHGHPAGLAVRSSALDEDAASGSRAGQYRTEFVTSADDLFDAVRRVAASGPTGMVAVLLQTALTPRWAGVLFSVHPAQPQLEHAYLEYVAAHGRGLVEGSATPLGYTLSRATATLDSGGDASPPALPGDTVHALLETLQRAEQTCDAALDIEWAVDESGALWLLQARPITAIGPLVEEMPPEPATSWFFDQRFTRPIAPLTRTTLIPLVLAQAQGAALAMRGRSPGALRAYSYAGQVYVATANYATMLAGAPDWWLTPDLRAVVATTGRRAPGLRSQARYLFDALRSVAAHAGDVFGNLPRWEAFSHALPAVLAAPRPAADTPAAWEAEWRRLDALSERLLALHRWSLLWADYGYRLVLLPARWRPAWRGALERWIHAQVELPTTAANAALAQLHAPDTPEAHRQHLLAEYGDRSPSLDYSAATWRELAARSALPPVPAAPAREKPGRLRGWRRWLLHPLVRMLELREEQRFAWERILARQRYLLLDAGKTLHARAQLDMAEDLWFLHWPELLHLLQDPAAAPPRDAIAQRRHAQRVYRNIRRPARLPPVAEERHSDTRLQGTAVSAGRGTGPAWVCADPLHAPPPPPGHVCILPALDPAMTPLLAGAAGVVVERGGLLSHGAILAREYGVPMVAGIEGACQRIPAGGMVTVCGDRGSVSW